MSTKAVSDIEDDLAWLRFRRRKLIRALAFERVLRTRPLWRNTLRTGLFTLQYVGALAAGIAYTVASGDIAGGSVPVTIGAIFVLISLIGVGEAVSQHRGRESSIAALRASIVDIDAKMDNLSDRLVLAKA